MFWQVSMAAFKMALDNLYRGGDTVPCSKRLSFEQNSRAGRKDTTMQEVFLRNTDGRKRL